MLRGPPIRRASTLYLLKNGLWTFSGSSLDCQYNLVVSLSRPGHVVLISNGWTRLALVLSVKLRKPLQVLAAVALSACTGTPPASTTTVNVSVDATSAGTPLR